MCELAQDWPSTNIVKHVVIVVGLVWKPLVIQKNILKMLAALGLGFNPDRRSPGRQDGSCAESWYFEARLPVMRE